MLDVCQDFSIASLHRQCTSHITLSIIKQGLLNNTFFIIIINYCYVRLFILLTLKKKKKNRWHRKKGTLKGFKMDTDELVNKLRNTLNELINRNDLVKIT